MSILRIAKNPMDIEFIRLREKSKPYWINDKALVKAVTQLEDYIKKLSAKAHDKKEYDRKAAVVMQWVDHHFKGNEGHRAVKDYFVELTRAKKKEWGENIPARGFHASIDKRLTTVANALNVLANSKIAAEGYQDCACRDCFDVAIGDDEEPAMCSDCEEAGCSPEGDEECHREDAYGG